MAQARGGKTGAVLIATALKAEKRALLAALAEQGGRAVELAIEVVGCGRAKVEERLLPLLTRLKPSAFFFFGAAGWLGDPAKFAVGRAWLIDRALMVERALMSEKHLLDDFTPLICANGDSALLQQARRVTQLPVAQVVTVDAPVTSRETRERLARTTGAVLVDMETSHLYRLAAEHGIPALALRVVTDLADERADREFQTNLEQAFRCAAPQIGAILRLAP